MQQLPIFVNLAGEPVVLVGSGAAADAKRRLIESAGGRVVEQPPARLGFVAIEDEAKARSAASDLRAAGILVNVVDRPDLCDFTVPAIVDRSPVVVAVGTGGASASLAKALRERLEALLPETLGTLARDLRAARGRLLAQFPSASARRRRLDELLAPGGELDPLGEPGDVERAMSGAPPEEVQPVDIAVVSDDPDDLTLKQLRWLSRADAIIADPDIPAAVLGRVRRDAVRVPVGAAASGLVVTLRRAR